MENRFADSLEPVPKNIFLNYERHFNRIPYDGLFMTDNYKVTDEFINDFFPNVQKEIKDYIKELTYTWNFDQIDYFVELWYPFSDMIADHTKGLVKEKFKI